MYASHVGAPGGVSQAHPGTEHSSGVGGGIEGVTDVLIDKTKAITARFHSTESIDETCVDTPEKRIALNHLHNKVNALEKVHENIDKGKDITKITMGTSEASLPRAWLCRGRLSSLEQTSCIVISKVRLNGFQKVFSSSNN